MSILFLVILIAIAAPFVIEMRRKPMDDVARENADGSFAQLSQGVTHYQWLGPVRGPVAVCVHGLTTPSFIWNGIAQGLTMMGFRVLIYDLYGRGYSDRPSGKQDRHFFIQQLDDLLVDQNVKGDITLLGYSLGGAIATTFAAQQPDKVRQLVLLAPVGMTLNTTPLGNFIAKTPLIGDWLMQITFPRNQHKAARAERQANPTAKGVAELMLHELQYKGFVAAVLASMRGLLAETLREEHGAIHRAGIPVLAVWAREDRLIPLSALGELTKWSRSTKQEVVDDAGHAMPFTHPEQVLGAMRETMRDGLN
ncbi:MAG: pimeloyl-ACP methyl ester carboxylesterase [Paracoccaceae bacterium]|jgi:pimeloyl-ACP methyl ester carboxylesterase